jgi:hypothetical protein
MKARQMCFRRHMMGITPNADDDPIERQYEKWVAVESADIGDITDVYWKVWEPYVVTPPNGPNCADPVTFDGAQFCFKYQHHATATLGPPTVSNPLGGDQPGVGPTMFSLSKGNCDQLAAGKMLEAAVGTGQMTQAEVTNIIDKCEQGEEAIFRVRETVSKDQPYGEYRVEVTVANSVGATFRNVNYFDVLPFIQEDDDGDGVPDATDNCPLVANPDQADSDLPAAIDLNSTSADLTVYGDDADDYSGISVAVGDINDDGIDDLIVGAQYADPDGRTDAGETYVIYGGGSLPSIHDLDITSADLTVYGADVEDYSAGAVGAGDINGDGTDDLIIGAVYGDGPGSGTPCGEGQVGERCAGGEAYVIYGGSSLPSTFDLNSESADLTVYGQGGNDRLGTAVAAGDINGDDIDDLILGADGEAAPGRGNSGRTYVIYGGSSLPSTIDLNSTPADLEVYGDDAADYSGKAVAVGDVNGDGIDDLITIAPNGDGSGSGTSCGSGQVGDRIIAPLSTSCVITPRKQFRSLPGNGSHEMRTSSGLKHTEQGPSARGGIDSVMPCVVKVELPPLRVPRPEKTLWQP